MQARLVYALPPSSDLVIFDWESSEVLRPCLPNGPVLTIASRGEVVFIHWKILLHTCKNFWNTKEVWLSYHLAILNLIGPKIVVTHTDNSALFWSLANCYKGGTLIALQNGWRVPWYYPQQPTKTNSRMILMTFGQNEIDGNREYENVIARQIPIGSVRADYYTELAPRPTDCVFSTQISYIVSSKVPIPEAMWVMPLEQLIDEGQAFVRSFEATVSPQCSYDQFLSSDGRLLWQYNEVITLRWLASFAAETGLSNVGVIFRGTGNWQTIVPPRFLVNSDFIPIDVPRTRRLSSYSYLRQADTILASGSALSLEALYLRKKVMINQPLLTKYQLPKVRACWWLYHHEYDEFCEQLSVTISLSEKTFNDSFRETVGYFSETAGETSATQRARSVIEKELAKQSQDNSLQ